MRPLRIVVGFAAGGGLDTLTRHFGEQMRIATGLPVIVDNRPGASGMVAAEVVSRAPADGMTLLMGDSSLLVAHHFLSRKVPHPLNGFTPVAGISRMPLLLVAHPKIGTTGVQEFLDLLMASPGQLSCGSPGIGTIHHLAFELLKHRSGCFSVHIPYRGASQLIPDLANGLIQLAVVSATAGMPHVKSGRIKAIALMSSDTMPATSGVSLLSDALPGFDAAPRQMLLAPSGTPTDIVESISETVRKLMSGPGQTIRMQDLGISPAYLSAGPLANALEQESNAWSDIVRVRKLSAQPVTL